MVTKNLDTLTTPTTEKNLQEELPPVTLTLINKKVTYLTRLKADLQAVGSPGSQITQVSALIAPTTKVGDALRAGFSLTTPPTNWYCGVYETTYQDGLPTWEEFPRKRLEREHNKKGKPEQQVQLLRFKGIVPPSAVPHWKKAIPVFSKKEIRIYSPDPNEFEAYPRVVVDPIMIGRIVADEPYYFLIAKWDLDRDLKKFLGQPAGKS